MAENDEGMLLGVHTPVVDVYAPHLLHPIPRLPARRALGFSPALPFYGTDIWHAYEMSWLDGANKPVARVGRFSVPADSHNMVESKSFKLYLNSLNSLSFASDEKALDTIVKDISAVVGAAVKLCLLPVGDPSLAGVEPPGRCLDELSIAASISEPESSLLEVDRSREVEERLYSHLLRSLCPVTGQPDWATVCVHYRGAAIDHASLLRYIVAYREHQEFHEQCVERMFRDIQHRVQPHSLTLQALYTRRGGLDIAPFRSTEPDALPLGRLDRQ